ncbi:MAG: adenylate kinase [Xanthomonadales bacterium PRO6]|nr:adenylate kinase [Xanthomonadales bacterium]MCE7932687.1 adenylate kinase [Xanthomonadales bacterium PRO6]
MRIVLLGAPGSGKGTQATLLKQRLAVPHISTGEILRAAVAAGTPLGLQAKAVMASGALVSDEIVLGMLEERFRTDDVQRGFILDGYPRNLAQARALDALLGRLQLPVQRAVQLDVAEATLLGRLAGRAQAEGRADDNPEAVAHRLHVYTDQTAPVIDFYQRRGTLVRVPGEGSVEEILERIVAAL